MKEMNRRPFGFSNLELLIILVAVIVLGGFVASKYDLFRQSSRDEQRKNDITSLQLAVQSYWAQTGKFPSLAQMNNKTFRDKNLNNVKEDTAKDPKWSPKNKYCSLSGQVLFQNTDKPNRGCYGYTANPANCDNAQTECSGYSLNARLEGGGYYSKSSS